MAHNNTLKGELFISLHYYYWK